MFGLVVPVEQQICRSDTNPAAKPAVETSRTTVLRSRAAGEELADPWLVIIAVELVIFAAIMYWVYLGCPGAQGGIGAILLALLAARALYDGSTLAGREYEREHSGRVTMGTVVGKLSSVRADGSQRIGARRYSRSRWLLRTNGFAIHDDLARLFLTGSFNAWVVEYRYGCEAAYGCSGRDFVPQALWRRLQVGQTVNVRRGKSEMRPARLDENPRWAFAMFDLAFGGVLLVVAAFVSGLLTAPRRREYLTAPAVVTAVEPVKYTDATRFRVRFAYFDPHGDAQESADEVVTATWKPGDACLAVFRAERPDIATFRPRPAA